MAQNQVIESGMNIWVLQKLLMVKAIFHKNIWSDGIYIPYVVCSHRSAQFHFYFSQKDREAKKRRKSIPRTVKAWRSTYLLLIYVARTGRETRDSTNGSVCTNERCPSSMRYFHWFSFVTCASDWGDERLRINERCTVIFVTAKRWNVAKSGTTTILSR